MNHRRDVVVTVVGVAMLIVGAGPAGAGGEGGPQWAPPAIDADPAELVDMGQIRAGDAKRGTTAVFGADESPEVRVAVRSADPLARDGGVEVVVEWTVHDHPHSRKPVFTTKTKATVPAGEEVMVKQALPLEAPGPYWVRAALIAGEETIKKDLLGILYDPGGFKPELTRPDDFSQFWSRKLEAMRKVPFDAELEENESYGTKHYRGYDLEVRNHDGKRLRCVLMVPRSEGPHDAEIGAGAPGEAEKVKSSIAKAEGQPAGVGMWERGARRIRIGAASPRSATYTRWAGRDDNNMLHCYLQTIRLADYLRSREDVGHIWLFGASRSGPAMLAAASLAPERVAAVNVHVPTSCGVSWKDRPYRGWGRPPARTDEGLKTAAYFDPVNFAPDLKVPVVMDGGFYDGLSPIPGMLAFCNHATNAPFVRWSIEQGRHGHFNNGGRGDMEAALAEHLAERGIKPGSPDDAAE